MVYIHIISLLIISLAFGATDTHVDEDSRSKLESHDIKKATKNAEMIEYKKINLENLNLNKKDDKVLISKDNLLDRDLLELKLDIKEKQLYNNHTNTRECEEDYYADGWCDDSNNTEECFFKAFITGGPIVRLGTK